MTNGLHERGDHQFQVWVTRDHTKRSQHSEQPENLHETDTVPVCLTRQDHVHDRRADNEKVKLVPTFTQVRTAVHDEAHCNDLDGHFGNKGVVEDIV